MLRRRSNKVFFSYVYSSPAYSLTSTITALATAIRKEHDQPKTPESIKVIRSADPHDMVISRVAKINSIDKLSRQMSRQYTSQAAFWK